MLSASLTPKASRHHYFRYDFAEARGPPQGDALWQHLFSANKQWGLGTIKQDHIGEQMGATKSGYTNVSVFKSWLTGMGDGAAANDVGVLYCCAPPNIRKMAMPAPFRTDRTIFLNQACHRFRHEWRDGSRGIRCPRIPRLRLGSGRPPYQAADRAVGRELGPRSLVCFPPMALTVAARADWS